MTHYFAYTDETIGDMFDKDMFDKDRSSYHNMTYFNPGIELVGKKKADLVVEGARIGEKLGVDVIHVVGMTVEKTHKVREGRCIRTITYEVPKIYQTQYWYVYKENGQWFFKMRKNCKTAHAVEI